MSSLHGMGTGDALDALVNARCRNTPRWPNRRVEGGPRRVALLGRPNVGKSSLLNKMAGENRVVVDELAGTTRDPVDEIVMLGDRPWRFIDTAGIRRRVHLQQGADFYASLRTQSALGDAEVAVVLLAVDEVLSEQDVRILQMTVDSGRAVVLAFNKWDLLDDERRFYLEREIERDLARGLRLPRVNISAKTGWHKDKLVSRPAHRVGFLGQAHPHRAPQRVPGRARGPLTRTPCAVASGPASSSVRRCPHGRPSSCCSPPASWIRLPPLHQRRLLRPSIRGHAH